ncbi:hypothetical protein GCM10017643_13860 [Ancylobacter dichloromethanicus]|uniref:Uncharacterized protein n=2 Tax=Ancylobacter dichloromethanicus TaxID=518825 RepID=A0A9W6J7I4_9HYPH|nr:hypothetical protein [Ancylobacter dichloromethanicus]GLK71271.1 hypothetical protein GCM10017643_13860 [Ancylobacter dichloromethanicus]
MPSSPSPQMKTERVHLMMAPADVEAIDDVRFNLRFGTRAKAIRFLVKRGLENVAAEAGGLARLPEKGAR